MSEGEEGGGGVILIMIRNESGGARCSSESQNKSVRESWEGGAIQSPTVE